MSFDVEAKIELVQYLLLGSAFSSLHMIWCFLYRFFVLVQTYQILNSDDHANFLRKHNRNPADYRPDIVHQVS